MDPAVVAVKAALNNVYDWWMYIFLVHSANDTTATDAAYLWWLSYADLCALSGCTDEAQRGVKQVRAP